MPLLDSVLYYIQTHSISSIWDIPHLDIFGINVPHTDRWTYRAFLLTHSICRCPKCVILSASRAYNVPRQEGVSGDPAAPGEHGRRVSQEGGVEGLRQPGKLVAVLRTEGALVRPPRRDGRVAEAEGPCTCDVRKSFLTSPTVLKLTKHSP